MIGYFRFVAILVGYLLFFTSVLFAANNYSQETSKRLMELSEMLNSGTKRQIYHALYEINRINPTSYTKEVKDGILEILKKEVQVDESLLNNAEQDGRAEDMFTLFNAVKNANDPRTVPYIIRFIKQGGAVSDVLAKWPDVSIDLVLEKYHKGSLSERSGATKSLQKMLKKKDEAFIYKFSDKTKGKIKRHLVETLDDEYHWNRKDAIEGLINIADEVEGFENRLKKIVKEDKFSKEKIINGRKEKVYPVRAEAKKALEKLKTKGIIKKEEKANDRTNIK